MARPNLNHFTAVAVLLAVLLNGQQAQAQANGPTVGTPQATPSSPSFSTNGAVQVTFSATASGGDPFNDLKGTGFGSRIARIQVLAGVGDGTWHLPSLTPTKVLDLISQFRPSHLNRFTGGPVDPNYVVGDGMTAIQFLNAAIARCANPNSDHCISARLDWVRYGDGTNLDLFINTAGTLWTNVYSQLSPPQRAIGIDQAHGRISTNILDTVSKALLAQGWKYIGWGANANTDVPFGDADWAMLSLNPTNFSLTTPSIPSTLDSIGGYVSYQEEMDWPNNWNIMISNYPTADDQTAAFTTIAREQTYPFIWVVAQEDAEAYYDSTAITNSSGETMFQLYLDLLNEYHVGTNYAWNWDFGDGGISTNPTPVHTYYGTATTNYTVSVTITDQDGNSSTNELDLAIKYGAPAIGQNPQTPFLAWPGDTVANSVSAGGVAPLAYQWQFKGGNLTDNGRIRGSQSNVLAIANAQTSDAGNYQVIITNIYGAATSSIATLIVGSLPVSFGGTGLGWSSNQSGVNFSTPEISDDVLTLTDNGVDEGRSFWFNYPQYVGGFEASFTYQVGGNKKAAGIAFVLQNDPRGTAALGLAGANLGVSGITPSIELELNIHSTQPAGVGYCVSTNGIIGTYTNTGSVNLDSGDPINVTLYYAQGNLALTFTDTVAQTSFGTNVNVGNLTNIVGSSTAYVGFTGSDGSNLSTQTITDFTFISIPLEAVQLTRTNAIVVSWPGAASGYTLQQNSDLTTANWVNVTNQNVLTNGLNQVVVSAGGSNMFYRLNLQP
jgi:PKD domain/Immunoglobulin I-set domain